MPRTWGTGTFKHISTLPPLPVHRKLYFMSKHQLLHLICSSYLSNIFFKNWSKNQPHVLPLPFCSGLHCHIWFYFGYWWSLGQGNYVLWPKMHVKKTPQTQFSFSALEQMLIQRFRIVRNNVFLAQCKGMQTLSCMFILHHYHPLLVFLSECKWSI